MDQSITILLPVYNDERWLEMTLESIKNQTFKKFRCIVGFNGTVDKSREIFRQTCGGDDRFESVDYGERAGKSITLNSMLDLVETEYTCLMDGDDIWLDEKLQKQIENIGDYDVLGTLARYINEDNKITFSLVLDLENEKIRSGFSRGHNQIVNSSCMVRTELFRRAGGWDPNVEGMEDFDMWVKIHLMDKKFKNLPDYLVLHRIHQGSNFNARKLPVTIDDILKKNNLC